MLCLAVVASEIITYSPWSKLVLDKSPSTVEPMTKPLNPLVAFSLETILGDNHEAVEHPGTNGQAPTGWDEEVTENAPGEGFCVECEGELCLATIYTIYPCYDRKISLPMYCAKCVPMPTVKCVLLRNIERDQEKPIFSNLFRV